MSKGGDGVVGARGGGYAESRLTLKVDLTKLKEKQARGRLSINAKLLVSNNPFI